MKKIKIAFVLLSLLFIPLFSCTTTETSSDVALIEKTSNSDYLAEGTVLAAFFAEDGGFSETRYYPAEVETQAGNETNQEYQVTSVVGDADVAEGETIWTKNVIVKSHPATKDELLSDIIILYTTKPIEEGLTEARWNRGIIASTDELYKGFVVINHIWYLDKSDESDRRMEIPIDNIRIIDSSTMQ